MSPNSNSSSEVELVDEALKHHHHEDHQEGFLPSQGHSNDLVQFDGPNDQTDPQNWSRSYKWTLIALLSTMTFIVNLAIPICAPAIPEMLAEFRITKHLGFYQTFILSVWGFGQIVGPLVLGPFSELYGRLPVYHVSTILFIVFSVGGAVSTNVNMVIAFRFLMGLMTVSPSLNPPIAGDLFPQQERGRAISMVSITPLLGTVTGPVIGGYLSEARGWRWTFWIVTILTAAFELALLVIYRETYRVTILGNKAKRLRRKTGNGQLRSQYEQKTTKTALFTASIIRPIKMLLLSPVVLLVSIYVALVYGYIYVLAATMTEVFEEVYGFGQGPVGLTYLGIGLGMLVGIVFCSLTMDRYVRGQNQLHGTGMKPEHRLMPMILGGILMPIGLFIYGWTTDKRVQWMVPIVGTAIFAFGVAVCQVVSSSYLVDAFGVFAASAVAASMSLRYLASAVLPIAAPPMYAKLGLGWGNSVLGFVALAFIPAPLLMMKYGERLRKLGGYKNIEMH